MLSLSIKISILLVIGGSGEEIIKGKEKKSAS